MLRNCFFANTIEIKREKSLAKTYFHDVPPKERKQIKINKINKNSAPYCVLS